MSKTIELLKKIPSKTEILHQHIADTYFYRRTQKKKNDGLQKRLNFIFLASSLFVISVILIAGSSLLYHRYVKFLKSTTNGSRAITVFSDGRVNNRILKGYEFRGYAKANSEFADKLIVLNSPKKYNWADLSIDFKFPIDFSKRVLVLSLKGKTGGEKLHLVLRDGTNRSCRLNDLYLTPDWKTERVSLDGIKGNIDLTKITHLRLEFGDVGESSKKMDSLIDVTIFIKTIQILWEG